VAATKASGQPEHEGPRLGAELGLDHRAQLCEGFACLQGDFVGVLCGENRGEGVSDRRDELRGFGDDQHDIDSLRWGRGICGDERGVQLDM
jgi:hypothetical protein